MTRRSRDRRAGRAGLTLVEMIMSITVFTIVLGVASRFLMLQSVGFRQANVAVNAGQNLRFAADIVRQDVAVAGANVPDHQPVLVYAGVSALAFNADFTSNLPDNVAAVFRDPDAPAGQVSAMTRPMRANIPGAVPAFAYPDTTYLVAGANSDAETIVFHFEPDAETARTDDYVLRRQVNVGQSEIISRNVLAYPGRPFFRYYRVQGTAVTLVPSAWLPLAHLRAIHLSPTDTGTAGRIDLIRAVEVNYAVSNGLDGARERTYPITFQVALPNMGMARLRSCGDVPLLQQALIAAVDVSSGAPQVVLTWAPATDEAQGERDVSLYVLWRRLAGAADWGDPYLSLPAGNTSYLYADAAVTPGASYEYALAAQDCTPALSAMATSATVIIP